MKSTLVCLMLQVSIVTCTLQFLVRKTPLSHHLDGSQEFEITVRTAKVTLVNDNVFICASFDVDGKDSTYITKIESEPIADKNYHIIIKTCDDPGYRNLDEPLVWECGPDLFGGSNPPLARAPACLIGGNASYGYFSYQYQGGSVDEGNLILPSGSGIPVGGQTKAKTVVIGLHFPSREETIDGTTGETSVTLSMVRNRQRVQSVSSLVLEAFGYVGPKSVGRVSGSWILDQAIPIHAFLMYTHWHELAVRARVLVTRANGDSDVILDQDPFKFQGVTRLADTPAVILNPGDDLTIECTYNNSMAETLRVWDREMCILNVFYFVNGSQTLDTKVVFSNDRRYGECFPIADAPGTQVNDRGSSSSATNPSQEGCST